MSRTGILAAIAAALVSATSAMSGNVDAPVRADGSTPLQWAVHEAEASSWHRTPRASLNLGSMWRRVGNWARVLLPE